MIWSFVIDENNNKLGNETKLQTSAATSNKQQATCNVQQGFKINSLTALETSCLMMMTMRE